MNKYTCEHIFVLKQSLAVYDFYTEQLAECDRDIEQTFSLIKPRWEATDKEEAVIMAEGAREKTIGARMRQKTCKVGLISDG